MKIYLLDMQNLEGISGGRRKGEWCRSQKSIFEIIARNHAATAAGDFGSLNIYRNDAGKYHCEFSRHWITISKERFTSQSGAIRWFKKWQPKLNRP